MITRFPELSVVLPAYNEGSNIENVVANVLRALNRLVERHEVLVVNDGSTDDTPRICERLAGKHPGVRVVHHERNKGYGAALKNGFSSARYRYVFYTDSDNQFDIDELQKFLRPIQDCDLVIGYRVDRQDSRLRKFLAWGFNRMVRFVFGVKVRDIDCAFKLFRKDFLDTIAVESEDFFVDAEMLIKARHYGCRLHEVGVSHYARKQGKTTVRPDHVFRTLRDIARFRAKMWFLKKGRPSSIVRNKNK